MEKITRLPKRQIAKEWGVTGLSPSERIGEVHFKPPAGPGARLLVKHLHTSAPLSVQVHPRHDAQRRGGKDEAWFILAAEPEAAIGLGPSRPLDRETVRAAALDGSLADLMDWRTVRPGDLLYCPSGTIHCIGAGISMIEIQENVDVTYRLFDFGRDRPLHLDEAVPAALLEPAAATPPGASGQVLVESESFTIERWRGKARFEAAAEEERPVLVMPLAGGASAEGQPLDEGEVYLLAGASAIDAAAGADLLAAYAGGYRAALRPRG